MREAMRVAALCSAPCVSRLCCASAQRRHAGEAAGLAESGIRTNELLPERPEYFGVAHQGRLCELNDGLISALDESGRRAGVRVMPAKCVKGGWRGVRCKSELGVHWYLHFAV